jgi:prepilin-type N-terminal cleavage/methylation domain-containing protein
MIIRKNTAGFTLVEIMIVVGIIGLLAAIAVPSFVQARTAARKGACVNNLRLIDAAKEQCALETNLDDGAAVDAADITPYLKGGAMPNCPADGTYDIKAIGTPPTCTVSGHEL